MIDYKQKKVFLIGRLPAENEVGGITTFIYNLSDKYKTYIDKVIDLYPSKNKIMPKGTLCKCLSGNILVRIVKLYMLNFNSNKIYHYNFSTFNGIIPLIIFPKLKNSKWILTLHNGEQSEKFNKSKLLKRSIVKIVLKRFDLVTVISKKQFDFYSNIVQKNKLVFISPYVKTSNSIKLNKNLDKVVHLLISGYPIEIYRHIETLMVLNSLWESGFIFKLNLCIYGFDTENLLKDIQKIIKNNHNISYYSHIDKNAFDNILDNTDIYIRMNSVDSFGLVVAEAIEKGIIVIATNTCERHEGAYLLDVDDFVNLKYALINILKNKKINLIKSVKNTNIISFDKIYSRLQEGI